MKKTFLALVVVSVLPSVAHASDSIGVSLGVGLSALGGLNTTVGYHKSSSESKWLNKFGVRFDFATTDPLKSAIDSVIDRIMRDGVRVGDNVKIDRGKFDARHTALLIDYYPFSGAWRLTGGYAWGKMNLVSDIFGNIETAPSQRFYFYLSGDHYYYNGNKFNGSVDIDWNFYGPYLGMGFDWDVFCGFAVYMDLGAVITNRPARIDINVPYEQLYIYNKDSGTWSAVAIPALDKDVGRAEIDANRKLSDFRVLPALKLGFLYRF